MPPGPTHELYKRVRVLCCHRGIKLMARLNTVTYDQRWFWHDQNWSNMVAEDQRIYDSVGFNNLAPRFQRNPKDVSVVVVTRHYQWDFGCLKKLRLAAGTRSWEAAHFMETWRPKLAQAFNTCNPMGLHTTGGYRAHPGTEVGAAEAAEAFCGFRSLFEDRSRSIIRFL